MPQIVVSGLVGRKKKKKKKWARKRIKNGVKSSKKGLRKHIKSIHIREKYNRCDVEFLPRCFLRS